MKLKPGKLYEVIDQRGIDYTHEENIYPGIRDPAAVKNMSVHKIFLFIEIWQKELNEYSKILVDGKVVITYNGYLLKNRVREIKSKNEQLSSTVGQADD